MNILKMFFIKDKKGMEEEKNDTKERKSLANKLDEIIQTDVTKEVVSEDEVVESIYENHGPEIPKVTLEKDVVLTEKTKVQLDECKAKLKYHKKIYQEWNFSSVDPLGRSLIVNFFGNPGTGKTLAAQGFAGSLGLPLIQVGIAELESKFMGETSHNIQNIFKRAHETQAVLFFDEADTLLGKRLSSVTQGVDNEVNAMRSTLLIELEKFDGIVIFATNFVKNYDSAFLSRISHQIEFELPDLEGRNRLWAHMLVDEIPLSGSKTAIVQRCAERSEGMSGREIRTCMRLSLPKAFIEAEQEGGEAILKETHLTAAIDQVITAKVNIKNSGSRTAAAKDSVNLTKKLLGVEG